MIYQNKLRLIIFLIKRIVIQETKEEYLMKKTLRLFSKILSFKLI